MLELVIPDTGPLITFGLIDRLDLLDRFNCAIIVTDMVTAEIRRGPDTAKDKPIVERWLASSHNRVQTCLTTYGAMWSIMSSEQRKAIKRQIRDAGEQSIREFLQKIEAGIPKDGQVLVLFEEDAVKRLSFGSKVHLIHSYAFMIALEELGIVPSAEDLYDLVLAAGRNLAKDTFERRASSEDGKPVDWQTDIDVSDATEKSGRADVGTDTAERKE